MLLYTLYETLLYTFDILLHKKKKINYQLIYILANLRERPTVNVYVCAQAQEYMCGLDVSVRDPPLLFSYHYLTQALLLSLELSTG